MKNIVMIGAIALRSPSRIAAWLTSAVSTVARRGSSAVPLPRPRKRSDVKTRSRANACRMRGAPIMLPSADDRVAAKTPAMISAGQIATSFMIRLLAIRSARSTPPASSMIRPR